MFGTNGQYTMTLIGFPIGLLLPVALWYLRRKLPKNTFIRGIHPIPLLVGGLYYAPYNLTYLWPAVPVGYASMVYLKTRFLGFWSRYNYTLSAAFSCGVAISAVIQFFGIQMPEISFDWVSFAYTDALLAEFSLTCSGATKSSTKAARVSPVH